MQNKSEKIGTKVEVTMKSDVTFLWNRFSMREALLLGFCATFIVLTKATLRMKLGISGHSMFFMIFFLLLARGIVPKTGAATLVGLLAGAISIALGLAHKGPVIMLNFVFPAIVVDAAGIFIPCFTTRFLPCLIIGGMAAATKGVAETAVLFITGASSEIVFLKTMVEGTWAAFFGILGSLPVPAIIRKLRTNRLISIPEDGKKQSIPFI